jgi:putative flippase GtrA
MRLDEAILKQFAKHRHLFVYGLVGICAVCVDFLVYTFFTTRFQLNYQYANIISVHCGIVCSFILNREFNFKVKDKTRKRFLSFYSIGLLGLLISSLLLYLSVDILLLNKSLSKLATIGIVAIIQFLLNKKITFKTI